MSDVKDSGPSVYEAKASISADTGEVLTHNYLGDSAKGSPHGHIIVGEAGNIIYQRETDGTVTTNTGQH